MLYLVFLQTISSLKYREVIFMRDKTLNNKSNLKSFFIKNLFGKKDVRIPFDQNPSIIIGENGTGKTTILSALYATLSGEFDKLRNIEFESIVLNLKSGNEIEFTKEDMDFIPKVESRSMREIKKYLSDSEIFKLLKLYKEGNLTPDNRLYRKTQARLRRHTKVNLRRILDELSENDYKLFEKNIEKIEKYVDEEIMYFPTYRRIEEDLNNLGSDLDIEKNKNNLIQFGMTDVSARFNEITSDIKNLAIHGFSEVTGEMLSQLVNGIKVTNEMKESIKNPEALEIVLDRSGDNLSEPEKEHIISLIRSEEIFDAQGKYDALIYFLSNLIKIYDQQREKDNLIKKFAKVCNKYLVDKKVVYNESAVEIDIYGTKTNKPIRLSKLSSGEKQIVSTFSKIYLNSKKDFVILFDEPELSLSIEWQKQLLPDILKSERCNFLLAATHSPFIFDNELDKYATDIDMYIEERIK
jgi:predicted ATP-binding protein involved in virulence